MEPQSPRCPHVAPLLEAFLRTFQSSTYPFLTQKDASMHCATPGCDASPDTLWLCLTPQCGHLGCSRYVHGHALAHSSSSSSSSSTNSTTTGINTNTTNTDHCIAVHLGSRQCWCFACDADAVSLEDDDDSSENPHDSLLTQSMALLFPPPTMTEPQKSPQLMDVDVSPSLGRAVQSRIPPTGLSNLGNTCYLNASLQALLSVAPLAHYFADLGATLLPPRPKSGKKAARHALCTTFHQLASRMAARTSPHINPSAFVDAFKRTSPAFDSYAQQDAQEFVRRLLDEMDEELSHPILVDGKVARVSVLRDVFQGKLRSRVKCLACGGCSDTLEPFWDLSLSIPAKARGWFSLSRPISSLHECLQQFFRTDTLEAADAYDCAHCRTKRAAEKQYALHELPNVLMVHLKRFEYTSWSSKIKDTVTFPEMLDLGCYLSQPINFPNSDGRERESAVYELQSIVTHMGSAAGGHYVASGVRSGAWVAFDDSSASKTTLERVLATEAYVLFYVLRPSEARLRQVSGMKPEGEVVHRGLLHVATTTAQGPWHVDRRMEGACPHGCVSYEDAAHGVVVRIDARSKQTLLGCGGGAGGAGGPRRLRPLGPDEVCAACALLEARRQREQATAVSLHERDRQRLMGRDGKVTDENETENGNENEEEEGGYWLMASEWWTQWRLFLAGELLEPPGPIDNRELQRSYDAAAPRDRLKVDREYRALGPQLYAYLHSIYGGGPTLHRRTPDLYSP